MDGIVVPFVHNNTGCPLLTYFVQTPSCIKSQLSGVMFNRPINHLKRVYTLERVPHIIIIIMFNVGSVYTVDIFDFVICYIGQMFNHSQTYKQLV